VKQAVAMMSYATKRNNMKIYMTRAQTRAMATMDGCYIGDPTGGPAYGEFNDPVSAVMGGVSLVNGIMGSNAASSAASSQSAAAQAASQASLTATRETNAMQKDMYDQNVKRQQPYVDAGMGSLNALQQGLAPGGQFTKTFGSGDLGLDPSYQFRLNQGTQNLNASAAARGLLGSGQNLKDITDYGQQSASQEYQNAFNRYQTNQSNLYNRMSGMATMSQNAAAGVGNQGMQVASNMAQNTMSGVNSSNNYLTSGAAANAAGQVGQANAWGGALQGGISNYMGNQQMQNQKDWGQQMLGARGLGGMDNPYNPNAYSGAQNMTATSNPITN
jgi:hypothetical protein